MKICSYNEMYLPLAQRVLGDMYDYAVNTLNYGLSQFHMMFIGSGMAHQFEIGNPTYVAGKNGCEISKEVIERCGLIRPSEDDIMYLDKSCEYWVGWALAYYQWKRGYKFSEINKCVSIEEIASMYHIYHEADISLLVEALDSRTAEYMKQSRLKRIRAYCNYSQSKLSEISEVPIRQIQLFEQKQRDINKSQGDTIYKLSKALNCSMDDLLQ